MWKERVAGCLYLVGSGENVIEGESAADVGIDPGNHGGIGRQQLDHGAHLRSAPCVAHYSAYGCRERRGRGRQKPSHGHHHQSCDLAIPFTHSIRYSLKRIAVTQSCDRRTARPRPVTLLFCSLSEA